MFLDEMTRHLERWRPADIEECGWLQVAYRPTQLQGPTEWHLEMLRPEPAPDRIYRDAPNRAAVKHNLDGFVREFERAFQRHAWRASGHRLEHWRDLLRLNIQHATTALRHVTNGQATVTLLQLTDGTFSVAQHEHLELFIGDLEFLGLPSLVPDRLEHSRTQTDAQAMACSWLSEVKAHSVSVRVQGQPAAMTWRLWGTTQGPNGHSRLGLVLTLGGRSVWAEVEPWIGAEREPYAVINNLSKYFPGVEAATCATCRHFAFSRMSGDMSGGWAGYCSLAQTQEPPGRKTPIVSVHERCDHHAFVADAERPQPYLRR